MITELNNVVIPLIVAAAVSVGGSIMDNQVQNRLLEDNIKAVEKLTESVNDLGTKIAVFEKTYVTKDELRVEQRNGS